MFKKIILIICIIFLAAASWIVTIRFLSGEDDWICTEKGWVKHGVPSAPMPEKPCGDANKEVETMKVEVYFNNDKMDPEFSCNKVFPVERKIPKTKEVARAAIEELLKGATDGEKTTGFFTSINSGVKIQSLIITNGVAKIDFDDKIEFQVGGSCRVSAIRSQIVQTLKQFPAVRDVVISVNGRTEDILQP